MNDRFYDQTPWLDSVFLQYFYRLIEFAPQLWRYFLSNKNRLPLYETSGSDFCIDCLRSYSMCRIRISILLVSFLHAKLCSWSMLQPKLICSIKLFIICANLSLYNISFSFLPFGFVCNQYTIWLHACILTLWFNIFGWKDGNRTRVSGATIRRSPIELPTTCWSGWRDSNPHPEFGRITC